MSEKQSFIVNIYIVASPLHCICAEIIANTFEENGKNYLFYQRPSLQKLTFGNIWDGVDFAPWPRFYPDPGILGRTQRTLKNLSMVASVCHSAKEIRLHAPVIDTEATNYYINYLQKKFPTALFSIRLIPDGLLNIQRHPLSYAKRVIQQVRRLRSLIYPDLSYYTFSGDRTGSDNILVDRIYHLPKMPHQYDRQKVVDLPPLREALPAQKTVDIISPQPKALVIGQPLVAFRRTTEAEMKAVTEGIHKLIANAKIEIIDYKAHPKDSVHEYYHRDYSILDVEEPLEVFLLNHQYQLIVGISSTALLTAKMICSEDVDVIAYGLDSMNYRDDEDRSRVFSLFEKFQIQIISSKLEN